MEDIPLLTIFTPTYNRAKTLKRVYISLCNQTSKNFVWQVIDDGSTDQTEELITLWIKENKISIVYHKQNNLGKAKTANKSLKMTTTKLWLCLDSDDWLNNEAVEKIGKLYAKIKNEENLCGMLGLRFLSKGQPMQGKYIPKNIYTISEQSLRYKLGFLPEYVEIYKTNIISNYSFPEISGEKYVPFSYIQDQLDQKYEMLVIHDELMYIEYQEDGLTKNKLNTLIKNPVGYMLFKKQILEFAPSVRAQLIAAITYNSACLLAKKRSKINSKKSRLLVLLTFPLGLLDYLLRFKLKIDLHIEKTF